MKLSQWLAEHTRAHFGYVDFGKARAIYPNGEPTADLYHLEDFRISSVSGPVVWLVPVDKTEGA